ncbi:F-box only protein 42 isoform X3 [Dasypus novemcinctus]|uniref:F-box only protein 42 isoform X3 n=1 Tax=Dasypus novemcinctus TaxID=9361 RepID=UPI0039C97859
MASSSDSEDDSFMAVDQEESVLEGTMEQDEETHPALEVEETRYNRSMSELPEEVLEYILSFLSPYQEHKTAALVCKQWYRLIKGVAHQCYHGFMKAVQEGNIQWESRTYPYPGTPITQRFSHSACYYDANQSMYVFGGCTQSSCNAAFNDLWRLDLNSKEWIRPLASGSYPSPKAGATLVVYKDLLVLFGGWTRPSPYPLHQPERFFDEIHTYSPSKNWWNCIVTTHGPPPMAGHSSCVIDDKMIVFGGSLGSRQMSNDVWVLDLEQWAWSKPNISGPSPHPRGGQSQIVIDDATILILGGCGGPNALFKDAWLLHMHSGPWAWQPLKVENEDHGAPELWCHPACRVGQCVVVFSQAPSGRAPLSPSLNSRPSPISATPPALVPETREYRSQSPVRGLLERPVLAPPVAIDTASYKIFVSGKSGVGKTALVAKLAGLEVPVAHHETMGIQTTVVFWPAKLLASDRVVMFRFEFWDCGESALKKFDHMLPACREKADAFLFLFSFTDRASFEDLPGQLAGLADEAPRAVRMVIGSKFDQYMHTDVPERDLAAFRQAWELPLLRVKSVPGRRLPDGRTLDGRAGLADVAHVLNSLAEQLWHQDQVAAGLLPSTPENAPGQEVVAC